MFTLSVHYKNHFVIIWQNLPGDRAIVTFVTRFYNIDTAVLELNF